MPVPSAGHVVVGGGTGFIGSNLIKLLRNKGYEYTIISRMPGPKHMSWHDIAGVGLPTDTTAVINLAGQNVLDVKQRWSDGFKQNVWNSRVNTTTALTQAITKAPQKIRTYITMSGVGIYRPDNAIEHSEDSDIIDFDFFSKLCIEWEKASKLASHIKCRQINLRCGVVIGRDGGMIKQLYLPFYCGLGGPVSPGHQFLPWIHVQDLSHLIVHAIERDMVLGAINCVAPEQITNQQFSDAFAGALWRPAIVPVPKTILNIIFNEERAQMLTTGPRVVPRRILQTGFKYIFPDIKSACKEVVTAPTEPPI